MGYVVNATMTHHVWTIVGSLMERMTVFYVEDIVHKGVYGTVQIGDQCWFSENCRYLPEVYPSIEGSETEPYYYVNGYQGTDTKDDKATEK